MKIVSACLVGIPCMWNGRSKPIPELVKEFKKGKLLPVCPEQLGGLPTPRSPNRILDATGKEVIKGKAKVINGKGEDVTKKFLKGSLTVLKIAKTLGIKKVILKKASPCCGVIRISQIKKIGGIYKRRLVKGEGVLVALLRKNKFEIMHEENFDD